MYESNILLFVFFSLSYYALVWYKLCTICVCVCVSFMPLDYCFCSHTKRIIPFQGILLPRGRDHNSNSSIATARFRFFFLIVPFTRVIVNYFRSSSSSCVLFLVISFCFDFESKCKPRVSYHRDHPLDFTSIFYECVYVWCVSSFF